MKRIQKLVYAALCLALCLYLPFLTGQIPQIGSALSPMHIPVLLCGFICGWPYALAVGIIAPLLRHVMFGMPPIMTAINMTFELGAYGLFAGLFYKLLPKKTANIYVSLVLAMLAGRAVYGISSYIVYGIQGNAFTMSAFMAGAFINAWPAIILHIVLVPVIVIALKKAKLMPND
jgi:riboflavin transporter FmnP